MAEALKKPDDSLYERDFYAWTQDQAAKLRARAAFDNRGDIDWTNAAEEIESLGAKDKREIRNRLKVLLGHLLKWRYQPQKRKVGWRLTIREQRRQITLILRDSPSLRSFPADALYEEYAAAAKDAAEEARMERSAFPAACPFSIEEVLDAEFYPEAE